MSKFKIGEEVVAIDNGYWKGMEKFTNSRLKVKEVYPNSKGEDCILCECLDRDNQDLFGPVSKFSCKTKE